MRIKQGRFCSVENVTLAPVSRLLQFLSCKNSVLVFSCRLAFPQERCSLHSTENQTNFNRITLLIFRFFDGKMSGKGYSYNGSGTNSQGNHYCSRDYGSGAPNANSYHYSNQDGSYYYSNPDGSTYHNDSKGGATYNPPSQGGGSSQNSSGNGNGSGNGASK